MEATKVAQGSDEDQQIHSEAARVPNFHMDEIERMEDEIRNEPQEELCRYHSSGQSAYLEREGLPSVELFNNNNAPPPPSGASNKTKRVFVTETEISASNKATLKAPSVRFAGEGLAELEVIYEDTDYEKMSLYIDHHTNEIKKLLIEDFRKMRERLQARHLASLQRERALHAQEVRKLTDELESLQRQLVLKAQLIDTRETQLQRLAYAHAKARQCGETYRLLFNAFTRWRHNARNSKTHKQNKLIAMRYRRQSILRSIFDSWRLKAARGTRKSIEVQWQRKLDDVTRNVISQYEQRLGAIQSENQLLRDELHRRAAAQKKIEEDMKKAFMRGVCALNFEAMALMKTPAGLSEVPVADTGQTVPSHQQPDIRQSMNYTSTPANASVPSVERPASRSADQSMVIVPQPSEPPLQPPPPKPKPIAPTLVNQMFACIEQPPIPKPSSAQVKVIRASATDIVNQSHAGVVRFAIQPSKTPVATSSEAHCRPGRVVPVKKYGKLGSPPSVPSKR